MEPVLRRVVSEQVERGLARMAPAKLANRSSPERIEGHDGRNLQLQFRMKLSLPLFTGGKVEGEQGAAIHIVLLDANNNQVVTSGPESSIKLDVVVLEGDFSTEDGENWSEEDFESHVVKEREGKRPLLSGDLQVTLKLGVGILGDLTFTDNSSWIRSRKFRLGVRVTSGFCEGVCIREAKTEAFGVKDHRGGLYKKHYPPALTDEVWRLEKIGKDGSFHKRLNEAGINTVEDFLRGVVRDSTKLRRILGGGMSNEMWDVLIEHAKTCALGGKLYVYYPNDAQGIGVIFNNIYEFSGLIASEQYHPADSLSDNQKVYTDNLVKKAYDDWMNMVENDGESLLSLKPNKGLLPRDTVTITTFLLVLRMLTISSSRPIKTILSRTTSLCLRVFCRHQRWDSSLHLQQTTIGASRTMSRRKRSVQEVTRCWNMKICRVCSVCSAWEVAMRITLKM